MSSITAQLIGDKAILEKSDLEKLVSWAKEGHEFEFEFASDDFSTNDIIRLMKAGKAFEFWNEPGEDIYSLEDGEPV